MNPKLEKLIQQCGTDVSGKWMRLDQVEKLVELVLQENFTMRNTKEYSEQYDAYYDAETNQWLESKCDDPYCDYCADRPEKPLNEPV